MLMLLALGTIPAGLVGITFKDFLEGLFSNTRMVGVALLITGGMNWMVDKKRVTSHESQVTNLKWGDALVVGVAQAIAIIPGISRSGSTIFAGIWDIHQGREMGNKAYADMLDRLRFPQKN